MSNPRLSIIPAGAVTDRTLEPRDLQMLALLGCYTDKQGWCRRSQVKMAKQLDCGRSSVQRSLDRLVEAGWVQKKRPPWASAEGQPSNSYEYRVILDRDDAPSIALEDDEIDDVESHASDANLEGECPPVGTPGAQPDGHPGAQPYVGTGAQPYVGTKNDPLERPHLERERDARARDRTARFIVDFEKRWPSAAVDDRQRTAYAAEALTEEEQKAALAGIGPFLDDLKRLKRSGVPAGWKYLEDKKWTLLPQKPETPTIKSYPLDSVEARAILILHDMVAMREFVMRVSRSADGGLSYRGAMNERLKAMAQAPAPSEWVTLTFQQAMAWERFLSDHITANRVRRMAEGSRAPWHWPPSVEGKIYTTATGPPDMALREQDAADFK